MEEGSSDGKTKAAVFDDLLVHIGELGGYQRRLLLLLCLPGLACAWHQLAWVILGATAAHRCLLPLEDPVTARFELAPAVANASLPWEAARGAWSQCERLDRNLSDHHVPASNATVACTQWVFDRSKVASSAVFEFGLVCARQWERAAADFMMMFGDLIGSIVFGHISDRFGRRPAFFSGLVLQVAAGTLASQAPSYWAFVLARFAVGLSAPGVYIVAFVLGMEMVGPSRRPLAGVLLQTAFSAGYVATALFALLLPDWRDLQLALSLPGILFLAYWWLVPESARWLVGSGHVTEGLKVLQHAARVNKSEFQGEALEAAVKRVVARSVEAQRLSTKASLWHVWRFRALRRHAGVLLVVWLFNGAAYYGLSWSSGGLGGDDRATFAVSGAVEVPAYLLLPLVASWLGRRAALSGALLAAAATLVAAACVPKGLPWLLVTLAMLGKFFVTAACGATYIVSAELFPTGVRNAAMGAGSTMAGVGAMLASLVLLLSSFWPPLPLLLLGLLVLVSGLLGLLLPETLHRRLPDTLREADT